MPRLSTVTGWQQYTFYLRDFTFSRINGSPKRPRSSQVKKREARGLGLPQSSLVSNFGCEAFVINSGEVVVEWEGGGGEGWVAVPEFKHELPS